MSTIETLRKRSTGNLKKNNQKQNSFTTDRMKQKINVMEEEQYKDNRTSRHI